MYVMLCSSCACAGTLSFMLALPGCHVRYSDARNELSTIYHALSNRR